MPNDTNFSLQSLTVASRLLQDGKIGDAFITLSNITFRLIETTTSDLLKLYDEDPIVIYYALAIVARMQKEITASVPEFHLKQLELMKNTLDRIVSLTYQNRTACTARGLSLQRVK